MVGHCLGAAGAIEAAVLALTVDRGVIPPTVNHRQTDAECDLDVVPNDAREATVRCGVSTSLAFGGNDYALDDIVLSTRSVSAEVPEPGYCAGIGVALSAIVFLRRRKS